MVGDDITFSLTCTNCAPITSFSPASALDVTLSFFAPGEMRIKIANPDETQTRFSVSDSGVGVDQDNL